MNLKEKVIAVVTEAATLEYQEKNTKSGEPRVVELTTAGVLPFSCNKEGELEVVLANVSALADMIIEVVSSEISDTILREGPWCSNQDHKIDDNSGRRLEIGSCPCYEFAARLALGAGSYISSDENRFERGVAKDESAS